MATIQKTIDLDTSVDAVWAKVSETASISNLIGFIASSAQSGNVRTCALEGGGELVEKVVSVDQDLRRVAYSITASPLNMEYHAGSMQVVDNGGKARFIWTTDVLPAGALDHLGPMIDGACADMEKTLALGD